MTRPITICIVGLGLMGGSLALALRQAGPIQSDRLCIQRPEAGVTGSDTGEEPDRRALSYRIIGVSRSAPPLEAALAAGAIDEGTPNLVEAVARADIVVLATPVRTILRMLPAVGTHARPGTLVLDLGSSKAVICAAMAELPAGIHPVGGHPMCGKETSGFGAAEAGLFRGRPFVLCPLPRTPAPALERIALLAEAVGATPVVLDPAEHDLAVAAISHLPYTLAVTLVNTVFGTRDGVARSLASSGFRDTSRLASSDVDMMLDIVMTNRNAILTWIDAFSGSLARFRTSLAGGDEAEIRLASATAKQGRSTLRL